MWLYFNKYGKILENLTHGPNARVGDTTFEIFAALPTELIENYPLAEVKFVKPDLYNTVLTAGNNQFVMTVHSDTYSKEEEDGNPIHFVDGQRYTGFIFETGDFTDGQEVFELLDTPGYWSVIITLYTADRRKRHVLDRVKFLCY